MEENKINKSVIHIVSLVLGIISIITAFFWYITLPSGIIAIVLGVKASHKNGSKMGKAGMITGIIGLSLFAFMYIGILLLLLLASIY